MWAHRGWGLLAGIILIAGMPQPMGAGSWLQCTCTCTMEEESEPWELSLLKAYCETDLSLETVRYMRVSPEGLCYLISLAESYESRVTAY